MISYEKSNPGRAGRRVLVFSILIFLCIAGFLLSVNMGAVSYSVGKTFSAIFTETEGVSRQIIWNIRLPRTLVAAVVGVCLSLSGCMLQGILRNPLASPNLIGVSTGAGLAGVIILILFPDSYYLLTPVAFSGAFLTTLLIYLLAWREGLKPVRLILAGVAVSSFLGAWISALMIFFPDRVQSVLGFMVGGLSARTWQHFQITLPYASLGLFLSFIFSRKLNILTLGDETARSLGLHVERTRLFFIMLASLLAASAVSVAGLLGFVGLIVPHMMRLLIGSDHRILLPASALGGAALLMIADTAARIVFDPIEIPVGIVMALLGAPFFLYLLRTEFKR